MKGISLSPESVAAIKNSVFAVVLPRQNTYVEPGNILDLYVEGQDNNSQNTSIGKAFVLSCWVGRLSDIPAKIINECPNPLHHVYRELLCHFRKTFAGADENTEVIAIRFVKIE